MFGGRPFLRSANASSRAVWVSWAPLASPFTRGDTVHVGLSIYLPSFAEAITADVVWLCTENGQGRYNIRV
jgi:hypothetical protein